MLSNALTLPHLLIIGVVVLVLFGRGKVSSLMGEVGKGITAFKKGVAEAEQPEAPPALRDQTLSDQPRKDEARKDTI